MISEIPRLGVEVLANPRLNEPRTCRRNRRPPKSRGSIKPNCTIAKFAARTDVFPHLHLPRNKLCLAADHVRGVNQILAIPLNARYEKR